MTADTSDIAAAKKALRERMKTARVGLTPEERAAGAAAIATHGLGFLGAAPGSIVSAFSSMGDELDTGPLLWRLAGDGYRLALPVMQGKGKPLLFRAWNPGDEMDSAVWGIAEPKADKPAVDPDILLVPLLAFDLAGGRLGYGGGFYDRTLRGLRAHKDVVSVGLAFDAQRVDAVPHLDYDERLDWVLTPSGPVPCRAGKRDTHATSVPG